MVFITSVGSFHLFLPFDQASCHDLKKTKQKKQAKIHITPSLLAYLKQHGSKRGSNMNGFAQPYQ